MTKGKSDIIRGYMAELGAKSKGKPKRISDQERERRRQWMAEVNRKRGRGV